MANNWKINETVDLQRGIDGVKVWPHALLVTGDENAHEWNVTVMDNGKAASLGGTIRAYFVRSDGATVTATGSVAGNIATVTLPEACYAYEGDLSAVMQLLDGDVSVTLSALLLRVRQISTDVIVDPGSEIPSLDDLLAQIEKLKQATKDANAATSSANTAASEANTAANRANGVIDAANDAADAANTAAENANKAAQNAESVVADAATKKYVDEQIDAIEIGSRNLLLDSGRVIENANYNLAVYKLSEYGRKLSTGETVTISCEVKFGEDVDHLGLFSDNGHTFLSNLMSSNVKNGKGVVTFKWIETDGKDPDNITNNNIYIFTNSLATSSTSEITNVKLERGNKPTDWSPAPEDLDAKIDNIEIGGTNLIIGSKDFSGDKWSVSSGNIKDISVDPEKYRGLTVLRKETAWNYPRYEYAFEVGKTYTLSLYAKCDAESGIECQFTTNTGTLYVRVILSREWKRYSYTFTAAEDDKTVALNAVVNGNVYVSGYKLELGNKPTDWSPAPEDTGRAISRRSAVTYDYGGRNLKEVFGAPEALHTALAAEDYTNIAAGDYWPIALNGTFRDYGSYFVPLEAAFHLKPTLDDVDQFSSRTWEGSWYSDGIVTYTTDTPPYTVRYVKESDCLPYFERTCNNVTVKLEIAGINHYWRYGDSGELASGKPHLPMISRDCLPFLVRMRKGRNKWEDETAQNPWLGSALFKTLNDPEHGLIRLLMQTELGPYIYAGQNDKGMRVILEIKSPSDTNATGWQWNDRGILFLPSTAEVWGNSFWSDPKYTGGLGNQFAIFQGSRRHISKGIGDSGSRRAWWLATTTIDNTNPTAISSYGDATSANPTDQNGVPICFIFA